ncbi:MAG TPA: STAS domain-containing protein [Burkholderiales bacterium]|nr:STAS domain-containing protein [Burkholderiales bacterium]
MVSRDGDIIRVSGPVTIDNVTAVIEAGRQAISGSDPVVDLSGLENVDSAAISMMLEWMRDAARGGRRVRFANLPENLRTLAKVYGVLDVLPLAG